MKSAAMKMLGLVLLFLSCHAALAEVGGFTQRLGAPLPLDAEFHNEQGELRRLGDFFDGQPVIVVLGYYHCPRLCSTVMDGVLQSMQDLNLPYAIVAISIDPSETPDDAARKRRAYIAAGADAQPQRLHLLTGGQPAITNVARQLGFRYYYDEASGQYTHPAGFVIATQDGRVSRYFPGLRFDQRDVRLSLIEASSDRIGTLSDRIILLCSHYDPLSGRYNIAVMQLLRVVAVLTMLALIAGVWVYRRRMRGRQ